MIEKHSQHTIRLLVFIITFYHPLSSQTLNTVLIVDISFT